MAKTLRVGFVGAGGIARGAHLPGFQALNDVQVVAAADIAPPALEAFASAASLPPESCFSDYRKMFEKVDLDIVVVCTPNSYHCVPTVDAFAKGCHVLVEKPVAISADQCREMIAAGHMAEKLLMVGQTVRFTKNAACLKYWVDRGEVGEPYWGRAQALRVRGVPGAKGFVSGAMSGGGPIYDIGVHMLDCALWLMGFPEPVSVSAGVYRKLTLKKTPLVPFTGKDYTVPDDAGFGFVRFANGATLGLEASWTLNLLAGVHNVVVCGERGGVQLEPPGLIRERDGKLEKITSETFPYPERQGHYEEVRQFVEAVRKGKPSPVPGEQALITQRILDAMYKSGEKGKEAAV